ncbi:MAG TPA: ComF family protein [Candidatus Kaiserbacteria bacterium]|nr:ComF family protein [Candidatus Kaiserbacteria bacterium]
MQDNIVHYLITLMLDVFYPPRDDEIIVRKCTVNKLADISFPKKYQVCNTEVTALLPFQNKTVRALIHEAKYHSNKRAFLLLGSVLKDYLMERSEEEGFGKMALVPIPISSARLKARGYNQTEKIAREAVQENIQLETKILKRVIDTVSQTTLPRRKRLSNMRGAFGAAHPIDRDCTYIIFDDVVTTGATMQSAIDALASGGATRIMPIALSH